MKYYAHSREGEPPERWQSLDEHLKNVADLAGDFASSFDAKKWGYCAGLLHDSGKATNAFQRRLRETRKEWITQALGLVWQEIKAGNLDSFWHMQLPVIMAVFLMAENRKPSFISD